MSDSAQYGAQRKKRKKGPDENEVRKAMNQVHMNQDRR